MRNKRQIQVANADSRLTKTNNPRMHSRKENGLPNKSSAKSHAKPPAKKKMTRPMIRAQTISRSI